MQKQLIFPKKETWMQGERKSVPLGSYEMGQFLQHVDRYGFHKFIVRNWILKPICQIEAGGIAHNPLLESRVCHLMKKTEPKQIDHSCGESM